MSMEMSRKMPFLVSAEASLGVLRVFLTCLPVVASSRALLLLWAAALIIPAGGMSTSSAGKVIDGHHRRAMRFTAEELMNTRFSSRISDDIDLDPCKGGE